MKILVSWMNGILYRVVEEREMGRVTVAITVSLWVIPISVLVNQVVLDPYMVRAS
uniref:Dol-P-Glc:Glc2Man9GlcNAc2-PP-Dol alpha-1 2-glucosyltransferase-like n=1 Tax=Rhizophora mucronata TaxID=61149 RepID=A0A2P2KJH0_RHIMU